MIWSGVLANFALNGHLLILEIMGVFIQSTTCPKWTIKMIDKYKTSFIRHPINLTLGHGNTPYAGVESWCVAQMKVLVSQ